MKLEVFLTAQAHRDIIAVKEYIEKDDPMIAVRVAGNLYDQAESLTDFPNKGIDMKDKFGIETDLQMLIVSPNLILYKIMEDRIIVTRVIDGRTDYLAKLELSENRTE